MIAVRLEDVKVTTGLMEHLVSVVPQRDAKHIEHIVTDLNSPLAGDRSYISAIALNDKVSKVGVERITDAAHTWVSNTEQDLFQEIHTDGFTLEQMYKAMDAFIEFKGKDMCKTELLHTVFDFKQKYKQPLTEELQMKITELRLLGQ